jgi:hypothetical protein
MKKMRTINLIFNKTWQCFTLMIQLVNQHIYTNFEKKTKSQYSHITNKYIVFYLITSFLKTLPNIKQQCWTSCLPFPIPFIWCGLCRHTSQSSIEHLTMFISLEFIVYVNTCFHGAKLYNLICNLPCITCISILTS